MTVVPTIPTELFVGSAYGLAAGTLAAIGVGLAAIATRTATDQILSPVVGSTAGFVVGGLVCTWLGLIDAGAFVALDLAALAPQAPRLLIAGGVVCLLSAYATSLGTRIGADLPRSTELATERGEPLAADAVDAVDALGQVTIRPSGEIVPVEGYPPLPPALDRPLATGSWRLPADLPLSALESRLERRLRTQYDLAAVSVSIDRRGRATIAAAPPASGVAGDVPEGWRAISVATAIPTGLAPGDEVDVLTTADTVSGTVLAVDAAEGPSTGPDDRSTTANAARVASAGDRPRGESASTGGVGRVTVCVPAAAAAPLLHATGVRLVVRGGAPSPDAAALSMLERAGSVVRHLTLGPSAIDAIESGELELLAVAVDAGDDAEATGEASTAQVATTGEAAGASAWRFPPIEADLEPGVEAFVAGDPSTIESLTAPAAGGPVEVGR